VTYEPELSEEVAARRKGLRKGWTTGTCASAAAKAAAIGLLTGTVPDTVEVALPSGERVSFGVEPPAPTTSASAAFIAGSGEVRGRAESGAGVTAIVVKDAGDDPDCTDGARMTATVAFAEARTAEPAGTGAAETGRGTGHGTKTETGHGTELRAGEGIGIVTKPGLGLPVNAPAINPVPRRMILQALAEVTDRRLSVTFSVPGGEAMAAETTNDRLGIVGGISILGTTGIVRPFSTASYRASVVQQIDVAAAQGEEHVVLATGHRSEMLARSLLSDLDLVCFVEVGDFTGIALRRAATKGVRRLHLVAMAGKLTKLAAGVMMTHFHRSDVDTGLLAEIAREAEVSDRLVEAATETATARHFAEVAVALGEVRPLTILCERARAAASAHSGGRLDVTVWISDFEGERVLAWAGEPPPPTS
jgi:cobalt-precorrin-5B (C1)-methyltransferase